MAFIDDLHAAVERVGVDAVAEAAHVDKKTVRAFLREPMEVRISTFSRLCRAVGMSHGEFHLIDRETGRCITCTEPRDAHYPLLSERAS